MHKKGFTLVELITVIILMGLTITIVFLNIKNIINSSKNKLYEEQINRIITLSKTWAIENTDKIPSAVNEMYHLNIQTLVKEGYLKSNDIKDTRDNSQIEGCVEIIYNDLNNYDYNYLPKNSCYDSDTIYTLSYELDGGILEQSNPTIYKSTTPTFVLNNPVKEGYSFAGWEDLETGTCSSRVVIRTGSSGNKFYKATWQQGTVNLTIDLDGGTYNGQSGNISSKEPFNSFIELNNPKKEGYVFSKWQVVSGDATLTGNTLELSTSDVVVKAIWNKLYTLTINLNGGSSSQSTTHYMIEGATLNLVAPTRTAYNFSSWSGTGVSGSTFTMGTSNVTITATWSPTNYTITYNLNGGSASNPTSYNIETANFTLNNPTKSGYIFLGWTGSNGSTASKSVTISKGSIGNKTYTANFAEGTYTFSYTKSAQTFVAPITGYYNIELYGASGGNGGLGGCSGGSGGTGGKGGYVKAKVKLTGGTTYTVYVGGAGSNGQYDVYTGAGGYSDGATSSPLSGYVSGTGGGGGGSTRIELGGTVYLRANGGGGGGGGADGGFYEKSNGDTTCGGCGSRNKGIGGGTGGTGGGGTSGGGGAANDCGAYGSNGSGGSYYVNSTYSTLISGSTGTRSGNGSATITFVSE